MLRSLVIGLNFGLQNSPKLKPTPGGKTQVPPYFMLQPCKTIKFAVAFQHEPINHPESSWKVSELVTPI